MPNVDFVSVLTELRNGKANIDASRKLSELVDSVTEHRKKGKFVLELDVVPSGVDEDKRVVETTVTWHCRITKPEADTGSSIFFVTKDGRLTRNDPNQEELFGLEEVVKEQVRG